MTETRTRATRAFTLVEILIVVVILGVLAAVVAASYMNTTRDAASNGTQFELAKIRRVVDVYSAKNAGLLPNITAGNGTWGALLGSGEYLKAPPENVWVGGPNAAVIVVGPATAPDAAYHTNYGWIFNTTTGELWAASFDATDSPLPRP